MAYPYAVAEDMPEDLEDVPQEDEAVESAREAAEAVAMRLQEELRAIIGKMEQEATRRVGQRYTLEQRWIEDLRQYHGLYDEGTERKLNDGNKSKLYINLTRPKADAMSARLMDLLFPTDDKNWGIGPTPVPSLKEEAAKAAREAAQEAVANAQAAQGQPGEQEAQQQAEAVASFSQALDAEIEEAKLRAERMEREIDDQLKESLYHAAMRDVIEDAVKLGTGVCKGPVTGDTVRKGWKKRQVQDPETGEVAGEEYALEMSAGDQPAIRHVDIWGFFPDMDARNIEESQGVYQRHLMNAKKLRALAKLPGFDQDAIRQLLKGQPRTSTPSYLSDLRNLGAAEDQSSADLYHVWEYSGPIEAEDMMSLAMAAGDDMTAGELAEADPLQELYAILWFCQGEMLKFALYPYDSYECMYSVFSLAKDEASIFGYGIPTIMRDPQQSLNAAWRAMMDNAGLSTGPQMIIARDMVEPADGEWDIKPRKVWWSTTGGPIQQAMATFDIPMQQQELGNIVATSKQIIDEMTAMPQIAQGEQGSGVTKTAQGMALLMNSANVVFRRIVKNFDDDVTTPNIRRFYDWNMQFNPKEEIKGDFEVDARGSSVLLVREMQAQNLMMIAMQLGAHPVFGSMLDNRKLLKKMFQAHMLSPDDVMLSDDEIDAMVAQAAQAQEDGEGEAKAQIEQAKLELEQAKLEIEIELKNLEWGTKQQIAALEHQTQMMKMAETMNMQQDEFAAMADRQRADLEAKLSDKREERSTKERIVAAEAAMKTRTGDSAGGYV